MDEPRVLLVEDDAALRAMLERTLRGSGSLVRPVASGEAALEELRSASYDLVLTDLCLGSVGGLDVMAAARALDPQVEVIIITGDASLSSAISACNQGAFRYIRKPLQVAELERAVAAALARRRSLQEQASLLRRIGAQLIGLAEPPGKPAAEGAAAPQETLRVGPLTIDMRRHLAAHEGRPLQLSSLDFSLLAYMAERQEEVVSPRQFARDLLSFECSAIEASELMKARVYRLRQKLEENPAAPTLLLSVRGVGYVLTAGRP